MKNYKTLIISNKLLQDTIVKAIRQWATEQEAGDKFGDITLREGCDDVNELANFIRRKIRGLAR